MKKTALTLTMATMLVGGLVGCGVGTSVENQARDNDNLQNINRGLNGAYTTSYDNDGVRRFDVKRANEGIRGYSMGGTYRPFTTDTGDAGAGTGDAGTGTGDAGAGAGDAGAGAGDAGAGAGDAGAGAGDATVENNDIPQGTTGTETGDPGETPIDRPVTEEKNTTTVTPGFRDVGKNNTHAKDIEWARQNNVISGHSDGSFRPNEALTRAQIATIIRNLVEKGALTKAQTQNQTQTQTQTPTQ